MRNFLLFFFVLVSLLACNKASAGSASVAVTSGFSYGFEGMPDYDMSRLTISVSFNQQTERADYGYSYDITYYNSADEVITTISGQAVAFVGGNISTSTSFNVNEVLLPEIMENIQYYYVIYRYTGYARVIRKSDEEVVSHAEYVQTNRVKLYSTGQKIIIS